MPKRILLVEDEPVSAKIIESIVTAAGYEVVVTDNGLSALEVFTKNPFLVVITDLEMPKMSGKELIGKLMSFDNPPVVFVQTVHDELSLVIDVMKMGVYDYLIKPVDANDLIIKMNRAFQAAEMLRTQRIIEKEKLIRLENQLEWVKWKERFGSAGEISRQDKTLFHSLQTSFNQGQGFGALITLLDIVSKTATRHDEHYNIDAGIMDVINENVRMARNALDAFRDVDWLITNELPLAETSGDEVYDIINALKGETEKYAARKSISILISEKKPYFSDTRLRISREHFTRAAREVILNACKFSEAGSDIIVMISLKEGNIEISFLNKPLPNEDGVAGIPMEYEYIIFEPFFRLTKTVSDGFDTLDFGLGLTIVEKIILRHLGKVRIGNIQDYTDISKGPAVKVNCVITIPLSE
jgi:YesN/AraC family two-component response regulator